MRRYTKKVGNATQTARSPKTNLSSPTYLSYHTKRRRYAPPIFYHLLLLSSHRRISSYILQKPHLMTIRFATHPFHEHGTPQRRKTPYTFEIGHEVTYTTYETNNKKIRTFVIRSMLSDVFRGISVNSITTDNDIAFTWWKTIESLLHTRIYVTHPYHSWEKGRVENTNRWIRCFVPKKRDIASVTQEELDALYAFLNDRPRKIIGFRTPFEYHRILLAVS